MIITLLEDKNDGFWLHSYAYVSLYCLVPCMFGLMWWLLQLFCGVRVARCYRCVLVLGYGFLNPDRLR